MPGALATGGRRVKLSVRLYGRVVGGAHFVSIIGLGEECSS